MGLSTIVVLVLLCNSGCHPARRTFVRVSDGIFALTHLRVIDGTNGAIREDQTVIVGNGTIRTIGSTPTTSVSGIARVIDFQGRTMFPGMVGMHDHLFYALPPGSDYREMLDTFPKLYLASGVTSLRTAGTLNFDAERRLKQEIDAGREIGPRIYLSSPYIDPPQNAQINPAALTRILVQVAREGADSVKVYTRIRRLELASVIETAHQLGLKVTGHLCAIGFTEAAALGIDNLEHGLIVDTEYYSFKTPDTCPERTSVVEELVKMDERSPRVQDLIHELVARRVAVTSTLPVFESFASSRIDRLTAAHLTCSVRSCRALMARTWITSGPARIRCGLRL